MSKTATKPETTETLETPVNDGSNPSGAFTPEQLETLRQMFQSANSAPAPAPATIIVERESNERKILISKSPIIPNGYILHYDGLDMVFNNHEVKANEHVFYYGAYRIAKLPVKLFTAAEYEELIKKTVF